MNFVNYAYSSWLIQALMNCRVHRRILNTDGYSAFIARAMITLKIIFPKLFLTRNTKDNLNYDYLL